MTMFSNEPLGFGKAATYERLAHEAAPDADALRRHLDPNANPCCAALPAEHETSGQVTGFALYFQNYATFLTRWSIYLEDLNVSVFSWNKLAIDFYRARAGNPGSGRTGPVA